MPLIIDGNTTPDDIETELRRLRQQANRLPANHPDLPAIQRRRDDLADHWLRLKRETH